MISQPLPAAWLAGWAVGSPEAGLMVGVLLQVLWGREFALGGASFPFTGPASVGAGALAAWWTHLQPPLNGLGFADQLPAAELATVLFLAVIWGELGRHAVQWIRRHRLGLVLRADRAAQAGNVGALRRANLAGLPACAGLGATLVLTVLVCGLTLETLLNHVPEADGTWVFASVFAGGLGRSMAQGASVRHLVPALLGLVLGVMARGVWT